MNCIPAIMKELGVVEKERFKVNLYDGVFYFKKSFGLIWKRDGIPNDELSPSDVLKDLIHGYAEVIKLPWKPKMGEFFYKVVFPSKNSQASVTSIPWFGDSLDCANYKVGNCFKTIEEAEKNKERIVKLLTEDGVLHE